MQSPEQTLHDALTNLGIQDVSIEKGAIAGQDVYNIKTTEAKNLIGPRGETIRALEYIVRKLVEKKGAEAQRFLIDIDNYRTQHIKEIEQKALMMADRAKAFEYDVELTPMSPYERLIVHNALSGMAHIKTESRGEGEERRVVIRFLKEGTPIA